MFKTAPFAFFLICTFAEAPALDGSVSPEVILDQAGPEIFPQSWRNGRIDAKAGLIDPDRKEASRKTVEGALALYPETVLKANLRRVYLLGRLEYSGVATGGTNSKTDVYVVNRDHYTLADVTGIFHAEFSSILFRNHPDLFDREAWEAVHPPDFTYRGSGVQAVREKQASRQLSEDLHESGFLHEYSLASIEEDFNSFAARLLTGDEGLWKAIESFPQIQAKAKLAMEFYGRLDPAFTPEFFSSQRNPPIE